MGGGTGGSGVSAPAGGQAPADRSARAQWAVGRALAGPARRPQVLPQRRAGAPRPHHSARSELTGAGTVKTPGWWGTGRVHCSTWLAAVTATVAQRDGGSIPGQGLECGSWLTRLPLRSVWRG